MSKIRYVGLDVHAESISVAVLDQGSDRPTFVGKFPNDESSVRKLIRKLGPPKTLKVAYEAGPTGYTLYRALTALGAECHVVAPTLIPVKTGDRVKTDRRDAEKLARCLRSGDLTDVWVPTVETEGFRDLVRAREAAKKDETGARHRLSKFLLRHGRRQPEKMKQWTVKHMQWVRAQRFTQTTLQVAFDDYVCEVEHASARIERLEKQIEESLSALPQSLRGPIEALQSLRGVRLVTAATIVSEVGDLTRFTRASELMAYAGLVPSENTTGGSVRRGQITKTGNAHLRRVLVESAWAYRFQPRLSYKIKKRQSSDSVVCEIAWKAQKRLNSRYNRLKGKGKEHNKVLVAVARELLGFIWAIGKRVAYTQSASGDQAA